MEDYEHISEKIHAKLNEWGSKLEQLQLQASLGKKDAQDEFEKHKKQMHDYLHDVVQMGKQATETSKSKFTELKSSIEEYKKGLQEKEKLTEEIIKEHKKTVSKLIANLKA